MKRTYYLITAISVFTLVIIICTAALIVQKMQPPVTGDTSANTQIEQPEPEKQAGEADKKTKFLLKLAGGKICVYDYHNPGELIIATEIYESMLPDADVEQLRRGIVAEDNRQLTMYLEDFGS